MPAEHQTAAIKDDAWDQAAAIRRAAAPARTHGTDG
jgi:hypothetical protein